MAFGCSVDVGELPSFRVFVADKLFQRLFSLAPRVLWLACRVHLNEMNVSDIKLNLAAADARPIVQVEDGVNLAFADWKVSGNKDTGFRIQFDSVHKAMLTGFAKSPPKFWARPTPQSPLTHSDFFKDAISNDAISVAINHAALNCAVAVADAEAGG